MASPPAEITVSALPKAVDVRKKIATGRNHLHLKVGQVWALLFSGGTRKILFSGRPDWTQDIQIGFRHLPHQIEFGPITEDSFQRFDLVVPLSLAALEEARRYTPFLKNEFPLPTAETVRLCDDKYEFNQALVRAGLGRYIPKMARVPMLTHPYILKKRIGEWGNGCYIIRNKDDEEAQRERILDPTYFCQEFITGSTEFATHILFVDGKIVKALNIKYELTGQAPIKGQDAERLRVICRCKYLNLFAHVLRAVKFEGLCCVNYKVAEGQPFLLEINPRFGGSLAPYFFSFVRHMCK